MGGGTGTGAAPVIAAAARGMGCVTVAVVTEPFEFEGRQRSRQAAAGLAELRKTADTVLVVANDKLLEIVPGRMTMSDAFLVADDVLRQGVSEREAQKKGQHKPNLKKNKMEKKLFISRNTQGGLEQPTNTVAVQRNGPPPLPSALSAHLPFPRLTRERR